MSYTDRNVNIVLEDITFEEREDYIPRGLSDLWDILTVRTKKGPKSIFPSLDILIDQIGWAINQNCLCGGFVDDHPLLYTIYLAQKIIKE